MNKKAKLAMASISFLMAILAVGLAAAKIEPRGLAECKDGMDNDGEGLIDWPDSQQHISGALKNIRRSPIV